MQKQKHDCAKHPKATSSQAGAQNSVPVVIFFKIIIPAFSNMKHFLTNPFLAARADDWRAGQHGLVRDGHDSPLRRLGESLQHDQADLLDTLGDITSGSWSLGDLKGSLEHVSIE